MNTNDFDYDLPEELIAQEPAPVRDACRLLVMDRQSGALHDAIFRDVLDYVKPGDVFVANETRVLPARLLGAKRETGGAAEVFLLRPMPEAGVSNQEATWEALVRPGRRLRPGGVVEIPDASGGVALEVEVVDWGRGNGKGERVVRLRTNRPSLDEALHAVGHTPLPPYIHGYAGDEEMYQTVYSRREASAAAPTAGLHFTPELIEAIKEKGAAWHTVELQVGLDTFRIVDEDDPRDHQMHTETYSVSDEVIAAIEKAHKEGGRVFAVGTTSVRSLESAWDSELGRMRAREQDKTNLFLLPGSTFHVVDCLITNFHVPRSTLMMLVSAFSSRENIMNAYAHAIEERYRMLSFGDAMLIV